MERTLEIIGSHDDTQYQWSWKGLCLNESAVIQANEGISSNIGLRFQNCWVDSRFHVQECHLRLRLEGAHAGTGPIRIYGDKQLNPPAYETAHCDPRLRPMTTAYVEWTVTGSAGAWVNSPDLTTVLNELIGQTGFAAGQTIAFNVMGVVGVWSGIQIRSYDGGYPPQLVIVARSRHFTGGVI